MGWNLHQINVKNDFLNGVIEEEVYIEKPQGLEAHNRVLHLPVEEIIVCTKASNKSAVYMN